VAAARRVVGFCTARVLDAELSGALPYLVTEYVEGVRLDRAIAARGRVPATGPAGRAGGRGARRDPPPRGRGCWGGGEECGRRPVTAAVDIFVWGSLVAFAGTGRRPFGQGTVVELVYRIRHEPPDLEGLEGPLRALVEACMDKDPEHRPTARTLLLELLGDHADPDPQAAAPEPLQRSWSPPPAAAPLPSPPPPATTPPRRRAL